MPSSRLFDRSCRVVVDTLRLTGFRVEFDVTRTIKPEPNVATIRVHNLNEDHRAQLSNKATIPVQIDCGYGDTPPTTIFLGNLRKVRSFFDGPNIVTEIQSGDKEKELKGVRIHKSYPAGTQLKTLIQDATLAFGLGPGNLDAAIVIAKSKGTSSVTIPTGTVVSGSAARELTRLTNAIGFLWSIQDGKITFIERDKQNAGLAVLLSPRTGLIGSPSIDNKGVMSCDSLIIPDLVPGRLLVLESRFLKGQFRIETAQYKGDTHGPDWLAHLQAKKY